MQQMAGVETQLGGLNRQETAEILHEGWAQKESRHLGLWRPRWLVLFRDRRSQLPVLCTFKRSRADWSLREPPPAATERIPLVGAICVPSRELVRGTPNVFWVQARSGNYFFAAGGSSECEKWARAIGESAAEAALRTSRAGGRPTSPIAQFGSPHFASPGDSPGSLRPPLASPGAIARIAAASSSCLAVAPSSAGTPADADAGLPPMASLEALVHGLEGGLHVSTSNAAAAVPKPGVLVSATAVVTSTEPPTGIAASVVGGSVQMRAATALGLSASVFAAGPTGGRGGGSRGSSGAGGGIARRHVVSWQTAAAPTAKPLVERISSEGTDASYLDGYDDDGSAPPATQAVGAAAAGRPASSSSSSGGEVAGSGGEGSSAALETLERDRAALQAQLAALIAHEHAAGAKAELSHTAAAGAAVVALGRTESEDSIGDGLSGREALRQQNDVLAAQIDALRSTLGRLAIVELRKALDESALHEAELVAELEAAAEAAAEAARAASAADVLAIALLGAACAAEAVAHALDTWTRGYVVAPAAEAAEAAEAARRADLVSDIYPAVVRSAFVVRMTEEPAAGGLAAAAIHGPEDAKTTVKTTRVAISAASSKCASDELNSIHGWFRRSVAGLVDAVTERSAEVLRMIDGPDDAVSPSASRTTSGSGGTVGAVATVGASSATAPATAPATVADSSSSSIAPHSSISPRRSRELALKELIVAGFTNEPWSNGYVNGFEATSFAGATDSPATALATVADSPTRMIGSSANGHAPRRASFEAAHHLLPFDDSNDHALDLDAPDLDAPDLDAPPPLVAPPGVEVEAVLQIAQSPRAAATDASVTTDGAAQGGEGSAPATDKPRASSIGPEECPEAAAARAAVESALEARIVAGACQEEVAALEEALDEVRERMGIFRQQLQQLGDVPERWGSSDSLPVYDEYDVDYDEGEEENEAYVPFGMGGQGEDRPSVLPWEALRT